MLFPRSGLVYSLVFVLISQAGLPVALRADDAASNLIKNPSFENPPDTYGWKQNNWAKNEVEFTLDPNNPHSGSQSQKITLKHAGANGTTDVQLVQQGFALAAGTQVELRFWARSIDDEKKITAILCRNYAPFARYSTNEVNVTPNWTEYVFEITLPADTDPLHNCVIFDLKDLTTIWIDDVSVKVVPPKTSVP